MGIMFAFFAFTYAAYTPDEIASTRISHGIKRWSTKIKDEFFRYVGILIFNR